MISNLIVCLLAAAIVIFVLAKYEDYKHKLRGHYERILDECELDIDRLTAINKDLEKQIEDLQSGL